jgi:hypothetical protein
MLTRESEEASSQTFFTAAPVQRADLLASKETTATLARPYGLSSVSRWIAA